MAKSPDAFRTISEVADWLGVQAHVLRFWESKFPQVKPMKRGGGRRYYRPDDLLLLSGIRTLLHNDGFTIKGVQKILREQGVDLFRFRKSVVALKFEGGRELHSDFLAEKTAQIGRNFVQGVDDLALMSAPKRRGESRRLFQVRRHPHFRNGDGNVLKFRFA